MRGRRKKHLSYKRPRRKSSRYANYTNVPVYVVVLFFVVLALLSIQVFYFFLNSYKSTTYAYNSTKRTAVVLPTGLSLFVNLPTAAVPSPTNTPTPKAPVIIQNDFCLNVPVLLYHHVAPMAAAQQSGYAQLNVDSDYFDKQMAYLAANGYHSLSADELADALVKHNSLPEKSILVTFDDGYDDNYNYAFQILKKYGLAGNFMIPTGLIENKGYMTWNQLREMAGNPLMHFYNHTWSHASLGGLGKDKVEYEIVTANKQLEDNLGRQIRIFTYPYGSFDQLVTTVLRERGFSAAFSTINGTRQCESYIYALRRTHIGNAPLSSYGL